MREHLSDTSSAAVVPDLDVRIQDTLDVAGFAWPGIGQLAAWHGFVFQSREFLELWMDTIGRARGSRCRFVIVSDPDGPVLLLPLCVERRHGVSLLRFLDGGVSDYNAPLLRRDWQMNPECFGPLWRRILARLPGFDAIELRKISARSGDVANPLAFLPNLNQIGTSRSVEVTGSWDAYIAAASRKRHHAATRRRMRVLERGTSLSFRTVSEPQEAAAVREFLFAHKRLQYLRTTGRDPFARPGYGAFFQRLTEAPHLGAMGHLSSIRCDGVLVAAHLGYQADGRFYQIMPVYDAGHAAATYSPGRIHLLDMLRSSFEAGCTSFEFGEGNEAYKQIWAPDGDALYLHVDRRTLKGRAAIWVNTWRRERQAPRALQPSDA